MIINPYFFEQPLLLDLYPNAATAYSVRKLRTAYTGNCIRVRRSSDNAEQNIGFVNNELDTTSLLSFVGAVNGFVTTWYDQSGNGFDVIQTAAANQPRIVNAGVLDTQNSKPTILFDGFNDFLTRTNINIYNNNNYRISFISNRWNIIPISGNRMLYGIFSTTANPRFNVTGNSLSTYRIEARRLDGDVSSNLFTLSTFNNTNMYLTSSVVDYTNADGFIYLNNNLDNSNLSFTTSGNTANTNSNIFIGGGFSSTNANSNISEVITYISSQNISNINTNIQTYFGI
jgi:hypothetical protein